MIPQTWLYRTALDVTMETWSLMQVQNNKNVEISQFILHFNQKVNNN